MSKPEHTVRMRAHAGEEAGAAGGAGGRRVECFPEKHSAFGETLDVGGGDGMAIRLEVAPGIVRVDVEDVGPGSGGTNQGSGRAGQEEAAAGKRCHAPEFITCGRVKSETRE